MSLGRFVSVKMADNAAGEVLPAPAPSNLGPELIDASAAGNLAQVRALLNQGVNVESRDAGGPISGPLR